MTKLVQFHTDVPDELIALLAEIRYSAVSHSDGLAALVQLEKFISTVKVIIQRKIVGVATVKAVALPAEIPQEAIDLVNRYDFTRIKKWQIKMALPTIRTELKKRGLL